MLADASDLANHDITLVANGMLVNVHPQTACAGRNCWIHNPSESVVSGFPATWRSDLGIVERTCPHHIGHPDPDDVAYNASQGRDISLHSCDGCC